MQNLKNYLHQIFIIRRFVRFVKQMVFASGLIMMTTFSGLIQADDTDIYFSAARSSNPITADTVLGRIFFLVDNSRSMSTIATSGTTRMTELKTAFRTILQDSADNLAMGIMVFNGINGGAALKQPGGGGTILFPMRKLNDPITEIIFEDRGTTNFDRRLAGRSDNDAIEILSNGAMSLTARLDIGAAGTRDTLVGLRFTDIRIPRNAVIQSVEMQIVSSRLDLDPSVWEIRAEASGNSTPFTGSNRNLSSRPMTTASATYTASLFRPFDTFDVCSVSVSNCAVGNELTQVIQEVVNQSDWCGGNALSLFIRRSGSSPGNRQIYGLDSGSFAALAPQLRVTYTTGTGDCIAEQLSVNPGSGADDAFETVSSSILRSNEPRMPLVANPASRRTVVGFRFPNLSIPQGATIRNARLQLRFGNRTTANTNLRVFIVDQDTMQDFTALPDDALSSGLPRTAARPSRVPPASRSTTIFSLQSLIQSVVNRPGWNTDSALGVIIESIGGSDISIMSREGPASQYPRLEITYESDAVDNSVRALLLSKVEAMTASNPDTPLGEAIVEGASYWAGGPVEWGSNRGVAGVLSHPASYCTRANPGDPASCPGARVNRPAAIGNYATDEYGATRVPGCRGREDTALACESRVIEMTSARAVRYRSPFQDVPLSPSANECGVGNHFVIMTDGLPNTRGVGLRQSMMAELFGTRDCEVASRPYRCGRDVVELLNTRDLDRSTTGMQNVTTHTISFYLSNANGTQFLQDIAEKGQGDFYNTDSVESLTDAFQRIIAAAESDNGSAFATPSLAANAFNRLMSRDEVYFGLFQPGNTERWNGNLKKYGLCVDSADGCTLGSILDADGNSAVGTDEQFLESGRSFWSAAADGGMVTSGGLGEQIDDFTAEKIYTDFQPAGSPALTQGQSLAGGNTELRSNNYNTAPFAELRDEICGAGTADCDDVMRWWLGANIFPTPATDTSADTRWTISDILHSSPVTITYGGNSSGDFYDRIIFGSNDGAIHFVNAENGIQEWRFYPIPMLGKVRQHYANRDQTLDHLYGMDLTPLVRFVDNDSDGKVEPGDSDFVHAYFGMRRGGSEYYALDITPASTWTNNNNTIVPKYLWRISRNNGFDRLGQTWSEPVLATLRTTSGTAREVLIFGGGYDDRLDGTYDATTRAVADGFGVAATANQHNMGNAIYFVDPDTGARLFSISGQCTGCNSEIQVTDMHNSIVAGVTVFDSDGDGFDDRLYVGDTGAQIWRVDIGAGVPSGSATGTVVGRLAVLGDNAASRQRKIFEKISVVQVRDTTYSDAANGEYDYVFVGTGDRANPLERQVSNVFYALRDRFVAEMPDANNNGRADSGYTLARNDLVNITARTDGLDANNAADRASSGWYYELDAGEKVLSASTAIGGSVFFTTHIPEDNPSLCQPALGTGRAYNFDVLTSRVALDWDADGDLKHNKDRHRELGQGIPSDIVPIFTGEGVVGVVGVEGGVSGLGKLSDLPRVRTYWYDDI